jgi:hypothetical protein
MISDRSSMPTLPRPLGPRPWARSTLEFAALHDHARLPARFFGRLTAAAAAGLSRR